MLGRVAVAAGGRANELTRVEELAFATENTKDLPQRVLPTFAVIIGGGGVPFDRVGTFNAASRANVR